MDQISSLIDALAHLHDFMQFVILALVVLGAGILVLFIMLGLHMENQRINHRRIMARLDQRR